MAIKINKLEPENIINSEDFILTPLYGQIRISDSKNTNLNKYSYFDTIEGYDLFVDELGEDTVAIKNESIEESPTDINSETIEHISSIYNVDNIKFDDNENAIIIKVSDDKKPELLKIKSEYENNNNYKPLLITPNVLFLEKNNNEIQLEDGDNPIDKLSDQDMKNVIQKAGVKLSGTENKERLKGIMQGVLSTSK